MLQPKRTKYRRSQKGRMRGNAQRGHELAFGSFGIKALENMWIEQRQIEAARVAVTRTCKDRVRYGFVYFQINLLLRNPLRFVWVRVRDLQKDSLLLLLRVVFFSKQMEFRMQSLRRHCAWQHKSYPSLLSSGLDVITLSSRETILNFETKNCKRNENIRD